MNRLFLKLPALLLAVIACPALGLDNLSEFSQPEGFVTAKEHKVGKFQVGFQHISEVDLSSNINEQPDGEDGASYTGSILANFSGKAGSSDIKGSAGVQIIEQDDSEEDARSNTTSFIGDLKVRSPLSQTTTNLFSLKSEEENANDSNLLIKTKSLSTTRTNTLSDKLEIALNKSWRVALDGTIQQEKYDTTNKKDTARTTLSRTQAFNRDNDFVNVSLTYQTQDQSQVYGIVQATQSKGGSFSSDSLEQDSLSIGVGTITKGKTLSYQLELAYGSSDATSVTNGVSSNSTEDAFFGRITAQYAISKKSRIYAGVIRSIYTDITTSNNAAVETTPVIHWQTDLTTNAYTGIRLDYDVIEILGTDMEIDTPSAAIKAGYRFSPTLNLEGSINYKEQTVNAAAQASGIDEFDETSLKFILNWYF